MRSTNASISPAVRGRPGPRWPLPSCQSLGFQGQSTALIVVKPKPTWAELLAQNPVLLAQVIDHLVFPLVHPSGHGDHYETDPVLAALSFTHYRELGPGPELNSSSSSFRSDGIGKPGGPVAERS
jgi:hypothetical protein